MSDRKAVPLDGAAMMPLRRTGISRKRLSSGKWDCTMVVSPRLYATAVGILTAVISGSKVSSTEKVTVGSDASGAGDAQATRMNSIKDSRKDIWDDDLNQPVRFSEIYSLICGEIVIGNVMVNSVYIGLESTTIRVDLYFFNSLVHLFTI